MQSIVINHVVDTSGPVAQLSGRLIGCRPVATELNCRRYNIKSLQSLYEGIRLKKCATVVLTSVPLQGMFDISAVTGYV